MKSKKVIFGSIATIVLVITIIMWPKEKKSLWVIYESHDQRQLSNLKSHELLRGNPGVYGIYVEGTSNDFESGQKIQMDGCNLTLYKEDPKFRRFDRNFLYYLFDSGEISHSKDLDTVIYWIQKNYPTYTIYGDQPLWKNSDAVLIV